MGVDVIIGLQRGDEGKGRFVDLAAVDYDVIARGNGGANAGHTVVPEGLEPIALHQIPSGIAYPNKLNIIGNGVYLDPRRLRTEIDEVQSAGMEITTHNLLISDIAHLVLPHHVELDARREKTEKSQGTTQSGISYVASEKYLREGVRVEALFDDSRSLLELAYEGLCKISSKQKSLKTLFDEAEDWINAAEQLKPYVADTVGVLHDCIQFGDRILAEGAQAYWLDINHGMYPYVTSSSTTVNGLLDGLGVSPKHLGQVTGVAKVVKSHVGGGPFVTEITEPNLVKIIRGEPGETDSEYGATTKRARRVGYPDLVELRNAIRVNGVDELVLSKMDHISRFGHVVCIASQYEYEGTPRKTAPSSAHQLEKCRPLYKLMPTWGDISNIRDYSELPARAKRFVNFFQEELDTVVTKIGVGPKRNQVIIR